MTSDLDALEALAAATKGLPRWFDEVKEWHAAIDAAFPDLVARVRQLEAENERLREMRNALRVTEAMLDERVRTLTEALLVVVNECEGHGDLDSHRYDMTLDHLYEIAAAVLSEPVEAE